MPGPSLARRRMVRRQLVARGVTDPRVLAAMGTVPRELFVPESLRAKAYHDGPLPIGEDQTISQPYIVAVLLAALRLRGDETVLEVGTGSGYTAALLGHLAARVVTVERRPRLAGAAAAALHSYGAQNVRVVTGDGTRGVPADAPYGGIAVHAMADAMPADLLAQLADGAVLVVPLASGHRDTSGTLTTVTRTADGFTSRAVEAVKFVPLVADDA